MGGEELKGHLDGLLLAVVADGPVHGYALLERLRDRSGGRFELPEGTVYPALHRLEAEGLLSSRWETVTGRRRRCYALTAAGERELGHRAQRWRDFARAMDRVLRGGRPARRGAA
jgi:DNA-binding PadR family transcriptional regulator